MDKEELFDVKEKKTYWGKIHCAPGKEPELEIVKEGGKPIKVTEYTHIERERPRRKKKKKKRKLKKDRVYNRRWQILEFIRKHQPTTRRAIANHIKKRPTKFSQIMENLIRRKMVEKEENDIFEDNKVKYVYSIGRKGKKFLKRNDCNSFLWPDNPYDEGPEGERL